MRISICLGAGLAISLGLAGCDTIESRNAAAGAVTGGANGAMIGASLSMGHPAGIVVGGVVGAAGGAMAASAATRAEPPARVAAITPPPAAEPVAVAPPQPSEPQHFARAEPPDAGDYPPPRPIRPWANGYDRPELYGYYADRWAYPQSGAALGYAAGPYPGYAPFPPRPRRCWEWAYDFRGNPVCVD